MMCWLPAPKPEDGGGSKGRGEQHIPWCEISEALPRMWELFTSFCLPCMKAVSVQCFQSSQKPLMCNLVSLLYSHSDFPRGV